MAFELISSSFVPPTPLPPLHCIHKIPILSLLLIEIHSAFYYFFVSSLSLFPPPIFTRLTGSTGHVRACLTCWKLWGWNDEMMSV